MALGFTIPDGLEPALNDSITSFPCILANASAI